MTMARPNYFEQPESQPGLYPSISIPEWWVNQRFDSQTTFYKGLKDELISAGIVPSEAFSGMGKSCTRAGQFKSGSIKKIWIKKAPGGLWVVRLKHQKWHPPYQSETVKCCAANMKTWGEPAVPHQQNDGVIDATAIFARKLRDKASTQSESPEPKEQEYSLADIMAVAQSAISAIPDIKIRSALLHVWKKYNGDMVPSWES
jgi:hypothetical protein